MNLLKKWWNFLFGKKKEEEPVVLEETPADEPVQSCNTHLRFRKTCPECLRAVGAL
jgi:hypothetical protein